jgi:DNA helicase-2/ATP-dependent DNA helicase PcrA
VSLRDLRRKLADSRRKGPAATAPPVVSSDESKVVVEGDPRVVDLKGRLSQTEAALPELTVEEEESLDQLALDQAPHIRELRRLNPFQVRAILYDKSSLVTAQVGSGKTTVLVQKIIHLLHQGVDASRILVFTFTKKAAKEISDRLGDALDSPPKYGDANPHAGTFHSLAHQLLNEFPDQVNKRWQPGFLVLDDEGRSALLLEIIERDKLRILYQKKLSRRIDMLRAGVALFGNMKKEDDLSALLDLYEKEKQARNELDFDDLIGSGQVAAQRLVENNRPSWILVDEFQDTDEGQLKLLKAWAGENTKIFAVGDPDQVIYSWRNCGVDVFQKYQDTFDVDALELGINYRSSANILEAARFVLSVARRGSDPRPTREEGALVVINKHHNPITEACYLAEVIGASKSGTSSAILVRTRQQLEPLKEHLRLAGIDVNVQERPQDNQSLRTFCRAYFQWLSGGPNEGHLASWMCHEEFGIEGLRGRLLEFESDSLTVGDLLGLSGAYQTSEEAWIKKTIEGRQRQLHEANAHSKVEDFLRDSGILGYLLPLSSKANSIETSLRSWLAVVFSDSGSKKTPDALKEVLAALEPWEAHAPKAPALLGSNSVHLMTIHAAKGLEFDHVFISGANRGLIPLSSSWSDNDKETEERRLMFVAMTRARDYLEIGWFTDPGTRQVFPEPSPYLDLIPQSLVAPELSKLAAEDADKTVLAGWGEGDAVGHPRYGQGQIVAVHPTTVTVAFSKGRKKSFPLTLCPLTRT